MPALSFGIAWMGYALLVLGVATVRGCNVTFTQIAWPGKFQGCNGDLGGPAGGTAPTKVAQNLSTGSSGTNSGLTKAQAQAELAKLKQQYGSKANFAIVKSPSGDGYSVVATSGNASGGGLGNFTGVAG